METILIFLCFLVLQAQPVHPVTEIPRYFSSISESLTTTVSKECRAALESLPIDERWKYLDASGRPRSGILSGNVLWFGSFDGCLNINDSNNKTRYCVAFVQGRFGTNKLQNPVLTYGICVPDVCDEKDVTAGLENFFGNVINRFYPTVQLSTNTSMSGVKCYEKASVSTNVQLTRALFYIISALCVIGTVIEMILESFGNVEEPVSFQESNGSGKSSLDDGYESPERDIVETTLENERTPLLAGQTMDKSNYSGDNSKELKESFTLAQKEEADYFIEKGKDKLQHILVDFFLCFSLLRNSRKVLSTNVSAKTITSLDGVRVVSLFWVILGHTFVVGKLSGVIENPLDMIKDAKTLSMMVVTNAFFSVDSFFFLSGLLLTYNVLMHLQDKNGQINWKWFYLHRYLRLSPLLLIVILFVANIHPFLAKSPLWFGQIEDKSCSDYWWTNMLYINNFYPTNVAVDSCLKQTWYLAIDMQFFVISPIIIYLFHRHGHKGVIGTSVFLIVGSAITIAAIVNHYGLHPMAQGMGFASEAVDMFNYVYVKPYCRIQPYVVGLVFGYLIHTKLFRAKMVGWPIAIVCWIVSIGVGLALVYAPHNALESHPHHWTTSEKLIFAMLRHLLWGIALAWVIYACEYGYGGYVKEFLSAKFWIPLSRLTYSAFLVHYHVLIVMFVGYRSGLHYTPELMAYFFCSALVLSYAVAFVFVVAVEYPCANIEKLIFARKKKHGKQ